MKRIVVQEIDKYVSIFRGEKTVVEYLIYVESNGLKLKTFTDIGETAKKIRIDELLLEFFLQELDGFIDKENIIFEYKMKRNKTKTNGKK